MKRFFFLLILLTGFFSQTRLQAQSNVIDEVIWVVGDEAIFLSDVENMRSWYQEQGQRLPGDPYCFIPEQLAIQKLYLHQAKLDSIEVTDSEIYPLVERYIQFYLNNTGGSQEKLEEYWGKSIYALREEIRIRQKEEETIRRVQHALVEKIKISPSDVRSFYKRIPQDSLPFISTCVEVQIITLEPQVAIEEIDAIKNQLREFTEQINNGERTFANLARLYSDDKETAIRGGETGRMGKANLVPEYAIAAFDLNDTKRISRITETEYGFHIIQLIEKIGDRINTRHILRRPRVTKDDIDTAMNKLDSIRSSIVDNKYSFEEATFFSYDKDTRNNKGLMVNSPKMTEQPTPRSGTSRFEMSELPPEIAKAVNTLQVGEISKPFSMINAKSREIVAIVKLKSRIDGHKASLSEDFQALKAIVEDEKQEEILNKWIAKKQKETYIRINDNWKNCDFVNDGWIQK